MKSMKRKLCFVGLGIIFTAFSYSVSFTAYAEKITVTAFYYPPYMDESLPEKGLFCELAYEAYKSVGYEVSFKFYPLKRSTRYVLNGKALAQLGTEWNFPEESRKEIHPMPMFNFRVIGFYLKDRFNEIKYRTLKDLKGYRIGVIRGSSNSGILRQNKDLHVEEVNSMEQLFKKLYAYRNDIVFTVELSGLAYLKKNYPDRTDRLVIADVIQEMVGQIVFSKKYPDYEKHMNKFEEGLNLIRKNGSYLRVFEKYYGKDKVPPAVIDLVKEVDIIPE